MSYHPDYWCVVKVDSNDPHYRVFGSWSGSYVFGSSWRMNSGIVRVDDIGECYEFHGASGSIYKCHKEMYGCHWESQGELNRVLMHEAFSLLPENTNWKEMDWIIDG